MSEKRDRQQKPAYTSQGPSKPLMLSLQSALLVNRGEAVPPSLHDNDVIFRQFGNS